MAAPSPLPSGVHDARLCAPAALHPLRLRLAASFFARLRGLIGRPPLAADPAPEALLITGCPSVHTLFMRHAIDVAYLDTRGRVVCCVDRLRPWRASFGGARAAHALELPEGTLRRLGIEPGHRLEHPLFQRETAACQP